MNEYYVYILECSDGTYYTGITNNMSRRLEEHKHSETIISYTSIRLPVKLVYIATFMDVREAIAWEKQVKGWNRAKKKALIEGRFEDLPKLSVSKDRR